MPSSSAPHRGLRAVAPLLLGGVALLAASTARADAEQAIRDVFGTYRQAVVEKDGDKAASVLSPGTMAYYGRVQRNALFGAPDEVRALPVMERMLVLFLRLHVPREDLVRMSPSDVVAYSVHAGWVGEREMADSDLGEVTLDPDGRSGWGDHMLSGRPTGLRYRFIREENGDDWRFDLLPLLLYSNEMMRVAAEQSGMDEQQLVLELLRTTAGAESREDLWEPLFPEAAGGSEPAPSDSADSPSPGEAAPGATEARAAD